MILRLFSLLAALEVVKMTSFGAASDDSFIKMVTFSFSDGNGVPCLLHPPINRITWQYSETLVDIMGTAQY